MDPAFTANLLIVALVIYGTSLHEMGHAYVATWLGDPTPGKHGRLTWNPLPHLSPFITAVALPLIMYMSSGCLLTLATTPVDPTRFKRPLRDQALVAMAGPAMNFLLMGVLLGILWLPGAIQWTDEGMPANWLTAVLPMAAIWNMILGVFNLLPLPPLDGYNLLRPLLPLPLRNQVDGLKRMGMLSLIIVLVVGSAILKYLLPPLSFLFWRHLLPS